jgi:hypothetical protein
MKKLTKTITIILLYFGAFIAMSANTQGQSPNEGSFSGILKFLKSNNGEVFLALDAPKRVTTKGDDGTIVGAKVLQLAITNPEVGKQAMGLVGKQIECQGRPMAAHTQHHHTEVLLIVSSLKEITSTGGSRKVEPAPETEAPTLNPHSVEW